MTKAEAEQRIKKLIELINDYRYHYHVLDESIMSEAAADSLKHELTTLEAEYPELISPASPTQRVAGTPLAKFEALRHSQRMLSLNDVFNEKELKAWEVRVSKLAFAPQEYFIDIKMDGLACALVYQDGSLTHGITRGDGLMGENVTSNIRTIESIPLTLRKAKGYEKFLRGRTEIRGEIVMYKTDFETLNAERTKAGKALFANPRNTAAGTIRQLDPKLVAGRKLHFRAYDILRDDAKEVPTNDCAYQAMHALGFLVNQQAKIAKDTPEILQFVNTWETKRTELAFNTDGLVIKVNDRITFDRLGVVGKAPRAAVAYKYPAEQSTTKVKDIFVSIGRTGAATPVAMLEPVVVAGSTVQMATLHNDSEISRKDIRIGDTVIVHKAGDIIPEIIESLASLRDGSEKQFVMPAHCPECKTKLVKLKANEAVWRCPNEACPSRSWKRIEHFASKSALDIEGLGEKNVIALITAGLIKDPADIYGLTVDEVIKLDRFADVSANKLVRSIRAKKRPSLARFVYGLGIRHVGVQTAVDLANHFRSLEAIQGATIDALSEVEGVGEVVAESVVEWFSEPLNQELLHKFTKLDVQAQSVMTTGGKLAGLKFVVTGSLETMGREEAAEKIRNQGGVFQSSIGKDTDYLIVGANVGASKLTKAAKLGTKQINEQELIRLTND